jgi:predicted SnoaL-like aldol condensation-catalyzing enzyme
MQNLPLLDGARSACPHDRKRDAVRLIVDKYLNHNLDVSSTKTQTMAFQVKIQNRSQHMKGVKTEVLHEGNCMCRRPSNHTAGVCVYIYISSDTHTHTHTKSSQQGYINPLDQITWVTNILCGSA